jgi:hypothetical protein
LLHAFRCNSPRPGRHAAPNDHTKSGLGLEARPWPALPKQMTMNGASAKFA